MPAARQHSERIGLPFLILAALFVAALVTCNLIANKFVTLDLGFKVFVVSAGILPYPLTFLITDLLSEIYGRRRANQVVLCGFGASMLTLGALWLGDLFPAIANSPVDDEAYRTVFKNAWRIIAASMAAYLVAQFLDIRLFHFWKGLTRGKHLWLTNNFSTVCSQLVDTTLVVGIIFIAPAAIAGGGLGEGEHGPLPRLSSDLGWWERTDWGFVAGAVFDGWLFKVLCAAMDTPLFYAGVHLFRRYLPMEGESGEEPGQRLLTGPSALLPTASVATTHPCGRARRQ